MSSKVIASTKVDIIAVTGIIYAAVYVGYVFWGIRRVQRILEDNSWDGCDSRRTAGSLVHGWLFGMTSDRRLRTLGVAGREARCSINRVSFIYSLINFIGIGSFIIAISYKHNAVFGT